MDSGVTIGRLRDAAHVLRSGDCRARLRAIQTAQDALDAAKAEALAELVESKEFELDGASSVTTWARTELRLDARQTKTLVRAAATIRELPSVGAAAAEGRIRVDHLAVFAYGMKHISAPHPAATTSTSRSITSPGGPVAAAPTSTRCSGCASAATIWSTANCSPSNPTATVSSTSPPRTADHSTARLAHGCPTSLEKRPDGATNGCCYERDSRCGDDFSAPRCHSTPITRAATIDPSDPIERSPSVSV